MRSSFRRRHRWSLVAVHLLLVVTMLATMVLPAVAATPDPLPNARPELIGLLKTYGIIKGDETGNLNLDRPITRAEMITILARALGAETEAQGYKGYGSFSDTQGHWADAYISWAYVRKLVKGDGNGRVRPNDPISYAESLTLILRTVGKEPTTGDWPLNVLIAAIDLRLLPEGVSAANLNTPAVRGLVFGSLAKAVSTMTTPDGRTYLQTYVDSTPPTLTLDQVPTSTNNGTLRITGTAADASSVTVNGIAATVTGSQFFADLTLDYGNNEFVVSAKDAAGNVSSKTVTVARVHPVASIEIAGPSAVRPGGTGTYTITAKNAQGTVIPLTDATAKVEGNIGTFNLSSGTLTATTTAGVKGKITVTAGQVSKSIDVQVSGLDPAASRLSIRQVNGGVSVPFSKPMTVQVEVQNVLGQVLTNDYGRAVTLAAAGPNGLVVTPATAYTEGGVATFTVRTAQMGVVTLNATSDNLTGASGLSQFGTNLRVRLSATPSSLTIGGASTLARISAVLIDENGNAAVNNTDNDIYVQLATTDTTGVLVDSTLRIMRGANASVSSGDEGMYAIGATGGTFAVTGTILNGQIMTVEPASVTVVAPTIGAGTFWDVLGQTSLNPGQTSSFSIRLSTGTGATIPGSYAFQLKVTTSNNDPENVTLTTTSGANPITDGVNEGATNDGNDVIVRTVNGVANFQLRYNKPGQVMVTVVPVGATNTAYASDGTIGSAAASIGIPERTLTFNYSGTATQIQLVADSALGQNLQVGAVSNAGRSFTLRAILTDDSGNWIPGTTYNITLVKDNDPDNAINTTMPTYLTVGATDGKATFTVTGTATVGQDVYHVTASLPTSAQNATLVTKSSNTISLFVQNAAPTAPTILATRGTANGNPGALNYLAPEDTGLEFELLRDASQPATIAKVYRDNGQLIYTTGMINMTDMAPRFTVPKSALPTGVTRYSVSLVNGYNESARSLLSNPVTNAIYVNNISITGVKYQRSNKTLTMYGSGFGTNDTLNPALITIKDNSSILNNGQPYTTNLAGASVTVNNWNQITLVFQNDILGSPEQFAGNDVSVTTAAGWYVRNTGERSVAITTPVSVSPMAHIRYAEYDKANRRLYLIGDGFFTGTLGTQNLRLKAQGLQDIVLNTFQNERLNDNTWVIYMGNNTALDTNGTYTLHVDDNWFVDGTWTQKGYQVDREIYSQVSLQRVNYSRTDHKLTITGSGFAGVQSVSNENVYISLLNNNNTVTSVKLTGSATVSSDSTIVITLDQTAYQAAEAFTGSNIFVTADANWLVDSLGRKAAQIQIPVLRLLMPAQ